MSWVSYIKKKVSTTNSTKINNDNATNLIKQNKQNLSKSDQVVSLEAKFALLKEDLIPEELEQLFKRITYQFKGCFNERLSLNEESIEILNTVDITIDLANMFINYLKVELAKLPSQHVSSDDQNNNNVKIDLNLQLCQDTAQLTLFIYEYQTEEISELIVQTQFIQQLLPILLRMNELIYENKFNSPIEEYVKLIVHLITKLITNNLIITNLIKTNTIKLIIESLIQFPTSELYSIFNIMIQDASTSHPLLLSYLSNQHFVNMILNQFKSNIQSNYLSDQDSHNLSIIVPCLNCIIEESAKLDFKLSEEFTLTKGYQLLSHLILLPPFDSISLQTKHLILSVIENLVFVGPKFACGPLDEINDANDHNLEINNHNDTTVRNPGALDSLIYILLHPQTSKDSTLSQYYLPHHPVTPLPPPEINHRVLSILVSLSKLGYLNFMSINAHRVMFFMVESLSSLDLSAQSSILSLVSTCMTKFQFSPKQELSLLSLYLENSETPISTQLLIYQCLQNSLASTDVEVGELFQRVGLFSVVCSKFVLYLNILDHLLESDHATQLTEDWFQSEIKQHFPTFKSSLINLQEFWTSINSILVTLLEIIKSYPKLIMKFHSSIPGGYWACLHFDDIRANCLALTSALIQYNPEGLDPANWNSPSTLIRGNQILNDLVDYLVHTAPKWDRILIHGIDFLTSLVKNNPVVNQVFGRLKGFSVISAALDRLKTGFSSESPDDPEVTPKWQLIDKCFDLIQASLNRLPSCYQPFARYYGLEQFQKDFEATGILSNPATIHRGFGLLLSFIMNNKQFALAFDYLVRSPRSSPKTHLSDLCLGSIEYPILIPTLTHFKSYLYQYPQLESEILKSIWSIINASFRNHLLFSQQPVFQDFLNWKSDVSSRENQGEQNTFHWCTSIVQSLMEFGSGDLGTSQIFKSLANPEYLQKLERNPTPFDELDLILKGIRMDPIPDLIHFDLGCAHPSNQVANLQIDGISSRILVSGGLTWMMWIQVLNFDPHLATPLMTLVNSSQHPVYQWVLDGERKLHVQTNFGQPLQFSTFQFEEGEWYHIALVQNRGRLSMSTNHYSLFVNGTSVETQKCSVNNVSPDTLEGELKLILGGFPDVSSHASEGIWNLASFYGVEESLDASVLDSVYHKNINYTGTFQNFPTKVESGVRNALKRNISLKDYRVKDPSGAASGGNATNLFSLDHLFILINPKTFDTVLKLGMRLEYNWSSGDFILPNLKYPSLSSAFSCDDGIIRLRGKTAILNSSPFTHHIWRSGGCSLLIYLIDMCSATNSFETYIKILVSCLQNDPRFVEEMFRCHGYEVLSSAIKRKPELITPEAVRELWTLIGMAKDNCCPTSVENIYLLRHVLVDFSNWRFCSQQVQIEVISGFLSLLRQSSHINRTLGVMHEIGLLKKILFGLRYHHFRPDIFPNVISLLNRVATLNFNKETIRTLVAFVTATLSKDRDPDMPSSPRLSESSSMMSSFPNQFDFNKIGIIEDARNLPHLSHDQQVGNLVLEMVYDCLQDEAMAHQFSVAVTTKWNLLFIHTKSNPYQIVLVMRILSRLFYLYGPSYINRFKSQHQGYLILLKQLPKWWSLKQLYQVLLANLFGVDIFTIPMESNFDYFSLLSLFQNELMISAKEMNPESLLLILGMIKHCSTMYQSPEYVQSNQTGRYRSSSVLSRKDGDDIDTQYKQMPHLDQGYDKDFLARSSAVGKLIQTLLQILTEFYHQSKSFKALCSKTNVLEAMTEVIYPWILPTVIHRGVNADVSRPQSIRTVSITGEPSILESSAASILSDRVSTLGANDDGNPKRNRHRSLTAPPTSASNLATPVSLESSLSATSSAVLNKGETIQSLLEFLMTILSDSIFDPLSKPLTELDCILKLAPFQDLANHLQYEKYILNHLIRHLKNQIQLDRGLLNQPKSWSGLVKFVQLCTDHYGLDTPTDMKDSLLEFIFLLLELIDKLIENDSTLFNKLEPYQSQLYKNLNRRILWHLTFVTEELEKVVQCTQYLKTLMIHHNILMSPMNSDLLFWKCLLFKLTLFLKFKNKNLNLISLNIWKIVILKKENELKVIFNSKDFTIQSVMNLFLNNLELDLDSFYVWFDTSKDQISHLLFDYWERPFLDYDQLEREAQSDLKNALTDQIVKKYDKSNQIKKLELKIYQKYTVALNQWGKSLIDWDYINNRKISQDANDLIHSSHHLWNRWKELTCWDVVLGTSEGDTSIKWKLDFTEGPLRMRKKLKPEKQVTLKRFGSIKRNRPSSRIFLEGDLVISKYEEPTSIGVDASVKSEDTGSDSTVPRRPNVFRMASQSAPSDEVSILESNQTEEPQDYRDEDQLEGESDDDDDEENKNARVMRLLDLGETIIDAYNIGRVTGLDVVESLLLFCKNHIYVIDGYFYCRNGEIVEINEVPNDERDVYLQLLTDAADIKSSNRNGMRKRLIHQIRKSSYEDIREVHKRKFLLRNSALELFSEDGSALLLTTLLEQRDAVYSRLTPFLGRISGKQSIVDKPVGGTKLEGGEVASAGSGGLSILSNWLFGSTSLTELTLKWERREISNFEYIMHLNTLAGRSYNDLTQYPVFPWVLADYTSDELDFNDPKTFRDLSKPMGAQSEPRASEISERYNTWHESNPLSSEGGTDSPAFHYGTHYSSAMIVCWYLIRLEPFTSHHMKLQGGHFDHASRLFHSIKDAWVSASQANSTDVRELIPEFFYLPEFLTNSNHLDFGANQDTGEVIDSVILPPWAKGDPLLFIKKQREALECEYVSQNLHLWVDLIFGYKQRGKPAEDALNVFHHLSYGEAVDLDKIVDPVEKAATIGIINNFGQTPQQLFRKPHAPRQPNKLQETVQFSLRTDMKFLIRSAVPVLDLQNQVSEVFILGGKLVAINGAKRFLPIPRSGSGTSLKYFQWDSLDYSLKLVQYESRKQIASFENLHLGPITHLTCLDEKTFITAGSDQTVTVWELSVERNTPALAIKANWKGHPGMITSVAGSKGFGYVVIATDGDEATIWDAHRLRLVKRIKVPHAEGVRFISIEETSGNFLLASSHQLSVFTINGELLSRIELPKASPKITSALYLPPAPGELGVDEIIVTGHQGGLVQGWKLEPLPDLNQELGGGKLGVKWCLNLFDSLVETFDIIGHNFSDIVFLKALPNHQGLICGEVGGKIYQWSFPNITLETHLNKEVMNATTTCFKCQQSLVHGKGLCSVCGGVFCSNCVGNSPFPLEKLHHHCLNCKKKFQLALSN